MNPDYQIKRAGKQFRVLDPWGEYLVDMLPTREAASKTSNAAKNGRRHVERGEGEASHRLRAFRVLFREIGEPQR